VRPSKSNALEESATICVEKPILCSTTSTEPQQNLRHSSTIPAWLILLSGLTEIKATIERFTGRRLGPGTLYGAITRLEERRWIKPVKADDRRRPYTLTATGREYLKAQLGVLERVLKTAGRRLKHA
jgi:hypothetical protein